MAPHLGYLPVEQLSIHEKPPVANSLAAGGFLYQALNPTFAAMSAYADLDRQPLL